MSQSEGEPIIPMETPSSSPLKGEDMKTLSNSPLKGEDSGC